MMSIHGVGYERWGNKVSLGGYGRCSGCLHIDDSQAPLTWMIEANEWNDKRVVGRSYRTVVSGDRLIFSGHLILSSVQVDIWYLFVQ